ncbi:MAG TPA: LysM peptidoglycan-binding domain-containing protein [Candidatus Gracilibacteria bacterium]|nr:LysM peptidoglycan-binding domain-containing protein [Candidatus Gracilibacteria bacterium]
MKKQKLRAGVVSIFLFSVMVLGQASVVFGMGQVTLTVKNPDPYKGNHSWFVYEKPAGTIIEDVATLKNFGTEEESVSIYAVDATSSDAGSFILKFLEEDQRGIGAWTDVKIKTATLQPNETLDIPFTISIPEGATAGQYIGGLVVENSGSRQPESPQEQAYCEENNLCGGNISIKTRIGSRIYLTLPGETMEDISLTGFTATKTLSGTTKFEFTIVNKGNITYEPHAVVEVYDSMGNLYEKVEKTLGTSSPDTTIKPLMKMSKRPLIGNFTAKATVTFGRKFISSDLHGVGLTETKSVTFWAMPWEIILASAFVLFSGLALHTHKKMARKKYLANSDEYQVGQNEDLLGIARERDVPWKKIAKYNGLKAPYVMKPGDTIIVPKKKK